MPGKSLARQAQEAVEAEQGVGLEGQWHPAFAVRAHDMALGGATNDDIAKGLGVDVSTVERWAVAIPAFRKALLRGREMADNRVARSMFRAAVGLTVKEHKQVVTPEGIQTLVNTKELPPNVNAGVFWLTNRQPKRWQDRRGGPGGGLEVLPDLLSAIEGVAQERAARLTGGRSKVVEGTAATVEPLDVVPKG